MSDEGDYPASSLPRRSEEKGDAVLSSLFDSAVVAEEKVSVPWGYFVQDGVLMRKWMPLYVSQDGD